MKKIYIDVRENDEYLQECIKDSIHIPLSEFSKKAPGVLKNLSASKVILMCASGGRASLAKDEIKKMNLSLDCEVFQGGMNEWKNQNKSTLCSSTTSSKLPLMRQVQLGAGLLVIFSVVLSFMIHPSWVFLAAFVGVGLTLAGSTGFCGMAILLSKMPWNQK